MRSIRLTGKERTVIRSIDFATGCSGSELLERTRLDPEQLHDILAALLDAGFVEPDPYVDPLPIEVLESTLFEINPGYAQALREALGKGA